MYNYIPIWLGIYDTKDEAIIARFMADILIFKEFRNKSYDNDKILIYKKLKSNEVESIKNTVINFLLKKNIEFNIKDFYKFIENS